MIRQNNFGWLVCLVALLVTGPGSFSCGQESDEQFPVAPTSVRCYGRVMGDDGSPIENARVTLVAPHGEVYLMAGKIGGVPAVLRTTTNMEGSFSLEFSADDLRFLGVTPFVLMIQADGFATDAIEFTMTRMVVDLPHERILSRCKPLRLQIRDAKQEPAANVRVRIARLNKLLLPLNLEHNPVFESDADGNVALEGYDENSLRSIYVQSESTGNQLVPVGRMGSELVATLMPTGRVNGQIGLSDGGDVAVLGSRKAIVSSWQTVDSRDDGPRSISWQVVTLDEQGKFVADPIAPGTVGLLFDKKEWPKIAQRMEDRIKLPELTMDNSPLEWKLTYSPAREYTVKFVGENGERLPRLSFSNDGMGFLGSAPSLTNENGEYSVLLPVGEKEYRQLFPLDPFGRVSLDAFGIELDRLKFAEDGTPEPIRLTRARSLKGLVMDVQGNPVAGATVEYSYGLERFNQTDKTWTDNSGRFEIRGLPPNAALEITARKGTAMTRPDESAIVVAGPKGDVTLMVVEQPTASPTGRVVDIEGNPVSGATVSLNRVSVFIKESYGPEESQGVPWSAELPSVMTDSNGMFRYPATAGFADRIQVNISCDGFLPFRAPFVQGSRMELVDGQLRLGDYRLLKVPQKIDAAVRCIDQDTGHPVAGAELVFIGVNAGRTSATTGENGTVAMTLSDTSQVAAVRASGYTILFQEIDHIGGTVEFKLQKPVPGNGNQRLAWFDRNRQDYLDVAQRLFAQMEKPVSGESTFFRKLAFFNGLSLVDPDAFLKTMSDPDGVIEEKDTIVQYLLSVIGKRSPRKALELLDASSIAPYQKAVFLASFASMSSDAEMKDELFGEAIVALGALSGKDHLMATGFVARSLIIDGRIPAARSIVQSAWDAADTYRDLVNDSKEMNGVAEARIFAPLLALVDPDAALQLIPLLSLQLEIDSLKDESLGVLALCDWEQFQRVCSDHNLRYEGGGAEWIFGTGSRQENMSELVQFAIKTVEMLDDSTTRMALCLFAAQRLLPGTERDRLLAIAVRSWKIPEMMLWVYYNDPARLALQQLATFDSIQPDELDQLIFASLNSAPSTFDTINLLGVLGGSARLLGMRDPKLGRALLEPAFDDSVWMFDGIGSMRIVRNDIINSAVWIDPAWAGELAQQFIDRYSPDDPSRKVQIFESIITEMHSLVSGMK